MSPYDEVHSEGRTVFDGLKEKHPDQTPFDEHELEDGDKELPALMDVSVTSGHVERVARALHWGA